ncbi:DUF2808 domain-containing protein [Myxacorys almedinensis]|uniref:DUF2808 domain-containing protein n=1 Tax=Myxacorys almedinensis A TaxID=2690445 RepID=A0A8J8CJP2_9CYAN|nr:DUF2808 domain-containing protein [Myxacorys almedinensis]NDJ19203.1 DUF2808 domain-containing protein [Myxacorys almedinensis A]
MKRFIRSSVAAFLFTALATTSASAAPRVATTQATQQLRLNSSAPLISSSALVNDHHIIRVAVGGMALEDIRVQIPPQMGRLTQVRVLDGAGRAIPAKIASSREEVAIAFEQPVETGQTVQIKMSSVRAFEHEDSTLFYSITAKRVGIASTIPVGTARIDGLTRG